MGWMIPKLTCYGIVIYEGIIASLHLYPKYLDKYSQSIFTIVQEAPPLLIKKTVLIILEGCLTVKN